jgi:hypothetical protein
MTDAVEKVGGMPSVRNNRIAGDDFLNRSCAFGGRLESMLLGDPPSKSFFNSIDPQPTSRSRRKRSLGAADVIDTFYSPASLK